MSNYYPFNWFLSSIAFAFALLSPVSAQEGNQLAPRSWTSAAGTKIEGSLVAYKRGTATIAIVGKGNVDVKAAQLSPEDQTYLASWDSSLGTHYSSEKKIEISFSGTVASNSAKPGNEVTIVPTTDRAMLALSNGEFTEPLKLKILIPPRMRDGMRLIVYTVASDSNTKSQSLQFIGLKEGYNEVSVKSAKESDNTGFGPGKDYIWVYVFVADSRDDCVSPLLLFKTSVE